MALRVNLTDLELRIGALQDQLALDESNYNEALDNVWMLLTGYLVWIMSAGFCFLEMGSLRFKNAQNVLAKNIIVPVLGFLCWYITGYPIAFGSTETPGKFGSGRYWAMQGFWDNKAKFRHWFFQGCFCDTSASIVSGGVAERMSLLGYMIHTICITGFIYPICVYWAWSGTGWLNFTEDGTTYKSTISSAWYQDWAGSGVIHLVGGVAALAGAVIVGPRKGRFDGTASEDEFAPHSVPFTVLGTFILWFGWYGFNPGSSGSMHTASTAYTTALVAVNTTLAPCMAGLVVFVLRATALPPRRFDVAALCNGILAGCVAITAPCAWVKPWEAVVIGAIGGLVYCASSIFWPFIKVDDPIDALSVHLANGLWGALAIGFFGDPKEGIGGNGVFYGGNQLGVQVVACICFMCWSGVLSIAVFLPLRLLGVLRWSDTFQDAGADEMQHSPKKSVEHSPPKAYLPQ